MAKLASAPDRRLIFNPSNVPTGIETADMLSSFYSKAFRLSAEQARDVAPVSKTEGPTKRQGARKLTKLSHDKRCWKPFTYPIFPLSVGADTGSLCQRTKEFHRQMKEPDFRCYHLLLNEQAELICASTDDVGARAEDWRNTVRSMNDMHHQCSRATMTNPLPRMKMKS